MNLFTAVFSSRSVEVDRADRLTPAEDYLREYTLSCMLIDEAYIVVQNQPGAGGALPPSICLQNHAGDIWIRRTACCLRPPNPHSPAAGRGGGGGGDGAPVATAVALRRAQLFSNKLGAANCSQFAGGSTIILHFPVHFCLYFDHIFSKKGDYLSLFLSNIRT